MKIIALLFVTIFISSSLLYSQESDFGLGGFIGNGFGFNVSAKLRDVTYAKRNEIYFSIFVPGWSNTNPNGDEGYFDWFRYTGDGHNNSGMAIGYRLINDEWGYGGSIDLLRKETWKNYHSDVTDLDWHSSSQINYQLGLGITLCRELSDKCRANLYIGTNIGVMLGLEWFF